MKVPLPRGFEVLVRGPGVHRAVVGHAPEVFEDQRRRVGTGLRSVSVKRAQQKNAMATSTQHTTSTWLRDRRSVAVVSDMASNRAGQRSRHAQADARTVVRVVVGLRE